MSEQVCEDVLDVLDPWGNPVHIPGCWACVVAPNGEHDEWGCTCSGSKFSRASDREYAKREKQLLVRGPNVVDLFEKRGDSA